MERWLTAAMVVGLVPGLHGEAAAKPAAREVDPSRSIVKLYVTRVERDVISPWRPGWNLEVLGSGAVLDGGRVLTAAHVVQSETFVQVRPNGSARKFRARVAFVSHVADLALVEVDDPAFHELTAPLEVGDLPPVRAAVAAYGFPNGGETLSITEGVVARVEHGIYVHSGERLLAIQMDAAIAPGSSGGPLLRDGRVVGVAMQSFKDSAIGSAVPAPMVRQFLDDAADGRLQGVPELELRWQKLENPALKASVGLSDGATGVLVTEVGTPAKEVLERGDVLLAVGGRDVADDGTVELRPGERTDLVLAADVRQLGAWLPVLYLRRGTVRQGELRLDRARGDGRLVPRLFDRAADYYIYGGLVFVTLTRNFLDTAGQWAPPRLAALSPRAQGTPGQEVVLLADVLTAEVNAGYELGRWSVVTRVDGQEIRDLADLARLAGQSDGGPLAVFDLDGGERVVVDRTRAAATVGDVLAQYGLASDRSPRLAAILGEATAIETAVVASASGPSEGEER